MTSFSRRRFRAWLLIAIVIQSLVLPPHIVLANPNGGTVVGGAATINHSGPVTTINQSTDRAVINWNGFSIGANELTQFNMPSTTSAALNRVTGGNASTILGTLQANGQVYLINPQGILFGAGSQVHVGGLVASSLDVPTAQFMQGGDLLFSGDSEASVVNYGNIRAISGDIYLISRNVENHGTLSAPGGTVGLGAGESVLLIDGGNQRLVVQPSEKSGTVTNTGTIEGIRAELIANGGNVYALAINNEGTVRATGAEITSEGRVLLKANGGRVVNTGDVIARNADGSGGEVTIDAGAGVADVAGKIDVTGEVGGAAKILGDEVNLTAAEIDASGVSGGGEVLIGGDFQGQGDVPTSLITNVDAATAIHADALANGDGGRVVIWSSGTTTSRGSIAARGGELGGDGGFVEVSGAQTLDIGGQVLSTAPLGSTGLFLIDPGRVNIGGATQAGVTTIPASLVKQFWVTNNVQIKTSDWGTTGADTLRVLEDIFPDDGSGEVGVPHFLWLDAGKNVSIRANVRNTGSGDMYFTAGEQFNVRNGAVVTAGSGLIGIGAFDLIDIRSGASLVTNTGNVTLRSDALTVAGNILNSGSGALTVEPASLSQSIAVGSFANPAAPALSLDDTTLGKLDGAGFGTLVIGRVDGGQHEIDINSGHTFATATTFNAPATGGAITVSGDLLGNGASFIFNGSGATTTLNADVNTPGSSITYNDAVVVAGGGLRTLTGADITFNGTVDGTTAGAETLYLVDSGTTVFENQVGGSTSLASLTTDAAGSTSIEGGLIRTTGAQSYNDPVYLNEATPAQSTLLESTADGDIRFFSTLRSTFDGRDSLRVATGGLTRFDGAVGDNNQRLAHLITDGGGRTAVRGDSINTFSNQRYEDNVRVNASSPGNTTTFTGLDILFDGRLESGNDGVESVVVDSRGLVRFNGDVGPTDRRLKNLLVTTTVSVGVAANVTATNQIKLDAGVGVTQTTGDVITANKLRLLGAGPFMLNSPGGPGNAVNTVAGNVDGSIWLTNSQTLTVGSVQSTDGITATGNLCLKTLAGDLHVTEAINVNGTTRLNVAGSAGQTLAGTVTTNKLGIIAGTDAIFRADNDINILAADVGGSLRFDDVDGYAIGEIAKGGCFDQRLVGITAENACLTLTSIDAPINATGTVRIKAPTGLTQTATITADELGIVAGITGPGDVVLNENNDVNEFAAEHLDAGRILFNNLGVLQIGAVSDGDCFNQSVEGITTNDHDITVVAGGSVTLSDLISAGAGTVRLRSGGAIIDDNDSPGWWIFPPNLRTNISADTVNLLADTGIGAPGAVVGGRLEVDAAVVNARNTNVGSAPNTGIYLTNRLGGGVEYGLVNAQNLGNIELVTPFGPATLTDVRAAGGDISAYAGGALTATGVLAADGHAIDLTAFTDVGLGVVAAGGVSGGGVVNIDALTGRIVDIDNGLGLDVRAQTINLDASAGIGGSGPNAGIEVLGSVVNATNRTGFGGVYLVARNTSDPINFNNILAQDIVPGVIDLGNIELYSRTQTTLTNVHGDAGTILAISNGAGAVHPTPDLIALNVTTGNDNDIILRTINGNGDIRIGSVNAGAGTVSAQSSNRIVDHHLDQVLGITGGTINLAAVNGIGQATGTPADGKIEVAAPIVNAINTTGGGVHLNSILGAPVNFNNIRALTSGDINLLANDEATLTNVLAENGHIEAISDDRMTALNVQAQGANKDIYLRAKQGSLTATNVGSDGGSLWMQTDDGPQTLLGLITANNRVTLSSSAGVNQTGGRLTSDELLLLGGGDFVLTRPANDVTTMAANVDGQIDLRDTNDLIVGALNGTTGITTIDDNVRLRLGGRLDIDGAVNLGTGALAVAAELGAGQTAEIVARRLLLAGNDDFVLKHAGNTVETVAADVDGSAWLTNSQTLTVGSIGPIDGITATGNLCLKTLSGDLHVTEAIDVDGTTRLNVAGSAGQTLAGTVTTNKLGIIAGADAIFRADNDINILAADTGGSLRFDDIDGYAIGEIAKGGCFDQRLVGITAENTCLTVTSIDAPINVAGTVRIKAPTGLTQTATINANRLGIKSTGPIDLGLGNDVNTLAIQNTTSDAVLFADVDGFNIGTVAAGGCFTGGPVVGITNGGRVVLDTGGAVTQTTAINTKRLGLLGSGLYVLTHANNDVNRIAADTTRSIRYRDANDLRVGSVAGTTGITTTNDDVRLHTGTTLDVDEAVSLGGGDLTIRAGDAVTQSAAITARGLELLGTGPFDLTNNNNDVNRISANTSNTIQYRDVDDLRVGIVSGTGTSGITTSGDDVRLRVGGLLAINAPVTLGSGDLLLRSGGPTTQTQSIQAAGLRLKGSGPVILDHFNNRVDKIAADLDGPLKFRNRQSLKVGRVEGLNGITLTNADLCLQVNGDLRIGRDIDIGAGTARLNVGGSISQGSGDTITAGRLGIVAFDDVELTDANDVDVLAARILGLNSRIRFHDIDDIEIGAVSRGGCFHNPVVGIYTLDGNSVVQADGSITLTNRITSLDHTVKLRTDDAIIDNNDIGPLPVTNIRARRVDMQAVNGIGAAFPLGAIDVDVKRIDALNTSANGIYITSTRIGDQVNFRSVEAQGTGNIRLLAFDDAKLKKVYADDGRIAAASGNTLKAIDVETGSNNNIFLAAFENVEVGVVRAGGPVTGGRVTVVAGNDIIDRDNSAAGDIRGGQVNLLALDDIGSSGRPGSIEVRTSTVNAIAGDNANIAAVNKVVPVNFNHVYAVENIELRSRTDTLLNNVASLEGSIFASVRNANMTANHVHTTIGDMLLETWGAGGGSIDVTDHVRSKRGNIALVAMQDVILDSGAAGNKVTVHSRRGDVAVLAENLMVTSGGGKQATIGSRHGNTWIDVNENVLVTSDGAVARIGAKRGPATGNIFVSAANGDVVLNAGTDRAAIGHAEGEGNIAVIAGKNMTLQSTGGGAAQIGHDVTTGPSNILVGWDQIDPINDGGGRLTMTTNTAITAGGSPNQVRLFGTRRLGNHIAAGAIINGSPFNGIYGLFPTPPPGPFGLNIEFFNWAHETWALDATIGNIGSLPYNGEFMFYYVGPGLDPGQQDRFHNFIYGTDYDRFIRAEDWARTLEDWLLRYGQPTIGSLTVDPRDIIPGEIAGSGGGVNAQGAE